MQVSFERSKERIFTIMNAPIIAVAFVLSLFTGILQEKPQDKPQEKRSCPMHEQNPPGTEEMKRLHDPIQYNLESTERGARLRITTKNAEALEGVHEFLRFQIADHQTGDATELTKVP